MEAKTAENLCLGFGCWGKGILQRSQHLRICSKPYRKRYGSTWTRGKVPNRVGIENRPAIVDQKSRIGDWEADIIVGKGQKSALLTLVERVTRYTIICKLDSLKAEDTARTAVRALKAHKDRVHTITMDNGKVGCEIIRFA